MQVSFDDGKLFYKLYSVLLSHANRTLKIVPNQFASIEQYISLPVETRLKLRDGLFAQPELIDQFVQENPAKLPADELAVVASWKHAVVGSIYIFRYLKHYTVFLSDKAPEKAYGVLALADPLEDIAGPHLPILTNTVLLPLKGQIIYDGLLASYGLSFGPGIRRTLNESYKRAKKAFGIITVLPEGSQVPAPTKIAELEDRRGGTTAADASAIVLALGKAQVDTMFRRQADHAVDDSEFLPLVEAVLTAFEMVGIDEDVAEGVWEHAFDVYDKACKEAEPTSTTTDNRKLMQSYLLGKRRRRRK